MDCRTALEKIEAKADGLLSREAEAELDGHLARCTACTVEDAAISATGPVLRALTGIRAREKGPALDAMWTRVRAGIEESRETRRRSCSTLSGRIDRRFTRARSTSPSRTWNPIPPQWRSSTRERTFRG